MNNEIEYNNSFDTLADILENKEESTINLSSFDGFVQDTFALSYPQYSFDTWHIHKVCNFVDDVCQTTSKMGLVVLPRYHLKSTLLGYAFSIYRMLKSSGDGLYVSFKEELAAFHLSNMKEIIRTNSKLREVFQDMRERSESGIHYRIGSRRVRIFSSGIFGMKRGLHTDVVCLKPGTKIRCWNGYKNIEEIAVGTSVWTHLGRCRKVSKIMSRDINEEIIKLHLENGVTIEITKEHPVLTKRGWVKSNDLILEDTLLKNGTKIIQIEKMSYAGKVYNLEVEEDNSYVGKGIIFHNCIVDDILGTVENPLNLTELEKAEKMFNTEVAQIPNIGCPMIIFGTVMDFSDLLFKLKDNPNIPSLWLPALNPDPINEPERDVLWPARFSKEKLERQKDIIGWKAFSTEFLLMPVLSLEAYISREELEPLLIKSPTKYSLFKAMDLSTFKQHHHVVAGLDVGKRKNPSHLVIFIDDDHGNLINIFQEFWDGVEYIEQASRITQAIENFGIDKMYIDATRGEMEERSLPRECVLIKFTGRGQRNQSTYASDFARYVEKKKIQLIDDDRFISQITCMPNTLKAPNTAGGHADSFWSVALAVGAYQDFFAPDRHMGTALLGSLNDTLAESPKNKIDDASRCKFCNRKHTIEILEDGTKRCNFCFTKF